jgi:hypothetical protein
MYNFKKIITFALSKKDAIICPEILSATATKELSSAGQLPLLMSLTHPAEKETDAISYNNLAYWALLATQ